LRNGWPRREAMVCLTGYLFIFAEGSRQGHFFGFAFFTADSAKEEG